MRFDQELYNMLPYTFMLEKQNIWYPIYHYLHHILKLLGCTVFHVFLNLIAITDDASLVLLSV